jgi:hypothetical protein
VLAFTLAGGGEGEPAGPPRAVIVDQLSLTFPNPAFSEEATAMLEDAGYEVDYVPGEQVTVDYYRDLPSQDYDIVVLRIHAARHENAVSGETLAELFTSEPFDEHRYQRELDQGRLGAVAYYDDEHGDDPYFGIGPAFVVQSMRGSFDDTMVVMMGCNGLISDVMAEAFVRKGAGSFVSWDDLVSADHTDTAVLSLLRNVLVEELPVQEATTATMDEVGPDPFYDSVLRAYPAE